MREGGVPAADLIGIIKKNKTIRRPSGRLFLHGKYVIIVYSQDSYRISPKPENIV